MKLGNIFNGLRKGLEMIEKATKVLRSVEVVGKHFGAMVDELEAIWGKDIDQSEEEEAEEIQHA